MNLLAFTDIHASNKAIKELANKIKKHNPDILVCCGDISIFEHHLESTLKKLAGLAKPLIIIHGNHEREELLKKACAKYKNAEFIHKKTKKINDIVFVGYGGGGFSRIDEGFEQFIRNKTKNIKNNKIIFITHGPPYGTKLDYIYQHHAGCESYRKFITKNKNVILALSGHLHETTGAKDKLNNALLINPGPYGVIITL